MIPEIYQKIGGILGPLKRYYLLYKEEQPQLVGYRIPIRHRLNLYSKGFTSRAYFLYDFENYSPSAFLNSSDRILRTPKINGSWSYHLDNKIAFHHLLGDFSDHRIGLLGVVRRGKIHAVDEGQVVENNVGEWVRLLLSNHERVVVKPVVGGGGENVLICRCVDDEYEINGECVCSENFDARVESLEEAIVTEYVEQGSYSKGLYAETPNTVRVLTMIDPETGDPFIARAVQRIGTSHSNGIDNFSAGGLSAPIDVETGKLGEAVQYPKPGANRQTIGPSDIKQYESHPETGDQIKGKKIPQWETIRSELLSMCSDLSYIPYIGWDLLVIDDNGGFKIVEGNSWPGVKSLQVHEPLLIDDRIRQFYEYYGIVPDDQTL